MPRRTLPDLLANLAAAGADLATPAVAVFSVTRPEERIIPASLGTLAACVEQAVADGAQGPCLILYGHALAEAGVFAAQEPEAVRLGL
jgi:uroporphyrin-III C-methyltransferase/precorrin-2 dehydrogenase/sirohydrochlorin ferrochelatase